MQTEWRGHTLKVTGNWVGRYLFLAPQYELWFDDERLDVGGGPNVRPKLEAIIEEEGDGDEVTSYHLEADILSIFGFRPTCEVSIDGEIVHVEKVRVQNLLNPFLLLFIIGASAWMIYVGPDLLRSYVGM